jgi:hypothetical protein
MLRQITVAAINVISFFMRQVPLCLYIWAGSFLEEWFRFAFNYGTLFSTVVAVQRDDYLDLSGAHSTT